MTAVLYAFNSFDHERQRSYIFQLVKDRKLTDVYHSHDFYEWIYFLSGSATQLINEEEVTCVKNGAILLRPCDRHCFLRQSEDIEVVSLSVKREELELFSNAYDPLLLNLINSSAAPICLTAATPWDPRESMTQSVTEYNCKLLLSYFLHMYISQTDCLKQNSAMPQMLASAIEEMKKTENLKEGIPAFTALSHYSHSHLARLVKKHFGMSLKQYVNELRLQNAYNDIVLTKESTEEISESLGFSSLSHFNKIFKARFSVTPAALRKSKGAWTT